MSKVTGSLTPALRGDIPDATPDWSEASFQERARSIDTLLEASMMPLPSVSSSRPATKRGAVVARQDHQAVKQLVREMKARSGLSDAEIGRRMGVSRQAITEVGIEKPKTTARPRVPSFSWFVRLALICGARVIVEFAPKEVE